MHFPKWEHVDGEEKGAKDWALVHTIVDRIGGKGAPKFFSVREVRPEKWEGRVGEAEVIRQAGEGESVVRWCWRL